jgi:hypothetical protein
MVLGWCGKYLSTRGRRHKKPYECKFTVYVDDIVILDAIEIIPCSNDAIKSIEEVKVWKI